jgi:hypothetical protein
MIKAGLYLIFLLISADAFSQVFENETKADLDAWSMREKISRQRIRDSKIHSLKTFAYKADTSSGEKYLSSELTYNDSGNLVEYISFRKNGSEKYHLIYAWDPEGRSIEYRQLRSDGSNIVRETSTYDASGNKTETRTYGRSWLLNKKEKLWWRTVAAFNDRQNMTSQKFYFDEQGKKMFDRYEYSYYPDGSKKQTIEYSGKGKLRHTWNYDCDPAGVAQTKSLKDTSKICVRYEEDKNGNKIKVTDENVKYGKVVRIVHRYDKNENLLEEISYDSKRRPRYHSVFSFDEKNNCTGHILYQRNSSRIKERSEYHYNLSGNIEEEIAYKNAAVPEHIVKFIYAQ